MSGDAVRQRGVAPQLDAEPVGEGLRLNLESEQLSVAVAVDELPPRRVEQALEQQNRSLAGMVHFGA